MSKPDVSSVSSADVPYRSAKLWEPDITVRKTADGTLYVDQKKPLLPYPRRVTEPLLEWAAKIPDQTLYAERDGQDNWRRLTFSDAVKNIRCLGQFLLDNGLSADRPLAILSGNDLEHAMLTLAAIHVGIPSAAISPAYSLVSKDYGRLKEVFDSISPGMVFAADAELFGPAIAAVVQPDTKKLFTKGAKDKSEDFQTALATVATDAVDEAYAQITPDTVAKFLFTSGSTGSPKPVINTHKMICSNQIMTRETYSYFKDEPPILLDWAPWHHTAGGNKLFFIPVFNGGTLYIDDGKPTPKEVEKTVRNLKDVSPTWYFNVPKGFEALLPHLEKDEALRKNLFKDLKIIWYAGAGMAQHTWDALERLAVQTIGEKIIIGTGLGATETAPVALMCTWPQEKSGNVGLPCSGVSLKLVPMEGKLDARVKGPNITPGYWKLPELTEEAFDEEGYYRFGDALRFADPDDISAGFFFDGRTAENFKLDTGTWVSTGALRTAFINHFGDIVRDVAIAGADMPYLAGLVFPDAELLRELCGAQEGTSLSELCRHEAAISYFTKELQELAKHSTGSSTLVRRIILMDVPPSMEAGEQTDKGSINQRAIIRNRADSVAEIYEGSDRVISI
jgi:feruloyl-CoA synthase